jgi:iron complex outermembrane receptor protein
MRIKTPFQVSTLSAAIAATLVSGYTTAQESLLEEVIVTATRRAQSVQDIPINITALSSGFIERQRITDLSDIARVVPGLTLVDQGPRSGNTLTVRGLNVDSITSPDGENNGGDTVGIYLGEVPLYVDLKINDMERIEVLIGPQGTLYGAGTLGGALRYIPNKPQSDALSYQVRGDLYDLSEGDDPGYEGGGTINVPLIQDTLALRASVDYLDDPGFIDNNWLVREAGVSNPQPDFSNSDDVNANLKSKEDANDEETWSGRLALRYTGESVDSTLTYYYQKAEIGGRQINHSVSNGTGDYESATRFEEPQDRKNELLSLEIVADLGFAELTSATGYSEYAENGHRDQTDLLLTFEYGYEFFPSFSAYTREDVNEDTFTQELRLVSTDEGPLNWIVGAFYRDYELDSLSQEYTPGFDQFAVDNFGGVQLRPDSLEYYEAIQDEITETAAFGELGYQITDAWQVTVGARWFKFEDDASSGFALPLFDTVFLGDPQDSINITTDSADVDDDDVIFKFNTSYDFNDDIMGYLTVSEGYRLGGVNTVPACTTPLTPGQNVCALPDEIQIKSDTTTNYELGVHSQFGDSVILNASLYFIEWDDVQIDDITENGEIPIISNGGSAESSGIELSGQWYITPELSIMGSYAYTDAELTDDAPGLVGGADAFDGDRLPGSPEHQGFLAVNYAWNLNNSSQIDFDYSVAATSDVLTKVGERDFGESLNGYYLHYLSATWLKDNWRVSLYGDNIFDEYAVSGVRSDRSFVGVVYGSFDSRRYSQNVVRPRQIGLRFVYDFEG